MDKQQYTLDLQTEAEAKKLAAYICVGKLLDEGMVGPEGMDMSYYENALIQVEKQEKGNMKDVGMPNCRLSFPVRTMEKGKFLPKLEKGKSYRFYIRKSTTINAWRTFRVTDV